MSRFLLFVSCCLLVRAQAPEDPRQLWKARQYAKALPGLIALWQQPGERSWTLEYMIGTSQCRVGQVQPGSNALRATLHSQQLPTKARDVVQREFDQCKTPVDQPVLVGDSSASSQFGAGTSGKGGELFIGSGSLVGSALHVSPIAAEVLAQRLVPLPPGQDTDFPRPGDTRTDTERKVLDDAVQRLKGGGGDVSGAFAVVSTYGNRAFGRGIGACLQGYERGLKTQFDLAMPPAFLTVYAMPELDALPSFASRLHGLTLPFGLIAYSVTDDLSMVGAGEPNNCGSLAHELVHQMVRVSFGDSPAWIEEGLASEVAVTQPASGGFTFVKGWRDDMLNRLWSRRPTVAQLLDMDWTSYNASTPAQLQDSAAVHAMAACFIRYLQVKEKKLLDVYRAVRDTRFSADFGVYRTDREIVTQVLGKPLEAVDDDFVAWFRGAPAPVQAPVRK